MNPINLALTQKSAFPNMIHCPVDQPAIFTPTENAWNLTYRQVIIAHCLVAPTYQLENKSGLI